MNAPYCSAPTLTHTADQPPAHNVFTFDNGVTFSSNFDNGNLAKVERIGNRPFDFKIWTAPDNWTTPQQSRHCAWFHFMVSGLPLGCVLRLQIVNASSHSGIYKHDMRPVFRSSSTNNRWCRIRTSMRYIKEGEGQQLFFEHSVDRDSDKIYFAFTYPYSYSTMQSELEALDSAHTNDFAKPGSIFYKRELLTNSCDGRRVDLLTISSVDGASSDKREPLFSGLFPELKKTSERVPVFPEKEIIFISSRVHAGEVPAQHTFKGILDLLMDDQDLCGKELRARYVFKLIPMLNPDGVFRGHFRMDQHGHNLNRYYTNPDCSLQPAIYAAKSLLDHYAHTNKLAMYLDMHAHASKRGCFIYGNVLDSVEDQIQNQLYCKLISMNSAHFDYEGCLFSKEHMFRIDPGDQAKGLTAEGSGRVNTYLAYGLIHSYTLECNYNTSRIGNEVAPPEQDLCGSQVTPTSAFTTNPEKYTPAIYAGVGRACIIAMLDIRGHNPCSRIPKSKLKTLDRVRSAVVMEVRNRKEYLGRHYALSAPRDHSNNNSNNNNPKRKPSSSSGSTRSSVVGNISATQSDEFTWRRVVEVPPSIAATPPPVGSLALGASSDSSIDPASTPGLPVAPRGGDVLFIPARDKEKRRRKSLSLTAVGVKGKTTEIIHSSGSSAREKDSLSSAGLVTPRSHTKNTGGIAFLHAAATGTPPPYVKTVIEEVPDSSPADKHVLLPANTGSAHVVRQKTKLKEFFAQPEQTSETGSIANSSAQTLTASSESAREPLMRAHSHSFENDSSAPTPSPKQRLRERDRNVDMNDLTRGVSLLSHHTQRDNRESENANIAPMPSFTPVSSPPGMSAALGGSIRDLIREQSINKLIKMSYQQNTLSLNPSVPIKRPVPVPASAALLSHSPPPQQHNIENATNILTSSSSSAANIHYNSSVSSIHHNSNSSTNNINNNSGANHSSNPSNSGVSINSGSSAKESRKMLGKTLHAAGVALIVNGSAPGHGLSTSNSNEVLISDGPLRYSSSKANLAAANGVGNGETPTPLSLPAVPLEAMHSSSKFSLNLVVNGSSTGTLR